MAKTKEIRNRIKGVKNTGKITRAMQLVASSKMKRAQDAALAGRPYALQLAQMLAALMEHAGELKHPFIQGREVKTRGVLVLSTERGLCGPLNTNMFRELARLDKGTTKFITVGRKARQFVSRTGRDLLADFTVSELARFKEVRAIVEFMIEQWKAGVIDTIEILYPRFRNTLIQEPTLAPLVPLTTFQEDVKAILERNKVEAIQDERDFIFEPAASEILHELLDLFIKKAIYQSSSSPAPRSTAPAWWP